MEKISGLTLDMYDDPAGQVLKSIYPTKESLPGLLKTAMDLSPDVLERLPDDAFALVLHQGENTLRKYACVDAAHTAMSVGYFMVLHDKLPVEAIKTAAANLITACGWYDIEPPEELKKLSTGNLDVIGRQRIWKDTDGTTYGNDGTSWGLQKAADVVGTSDMPSAFSKGALMTRKKTPLASVKTASVGQLVEGTDAYDATGEDTLLEQAFGVQEENPKALPQVKKTLDPHVDVTDKEPPKLLVPKEAQYYALPQERRYPLDTYEQVKRASAYFSENYRFMDPDDRHTYARNLLERTAPLDIQVGSMANHYGQTKYASAGHVHTCVEHRIQLLASYTDSENVKQASDAAHAIDLYKELLGVRSTLAPVAFARTLGEIDKIAGLDEFWDQDVVDPFASTFAKEAETDATKDAIVVGNEYMTLRALRSFVVQRPDVLRRKFSDDMVNELQKDPAGIFASLPIEQKLIIMRIVNTANETTAT